MVVKQFVVFDEAAALLGTDSEGLRQGLELGLGDSLPVYVYAGALPLMARFFGGGVEASCADIHDPTSSEVDIPGIGVRRWVDFSTWNDLGDQFCEISDVDSPQFRTGYPLVVSLKGFFRVNPLQLKQSAREWHFGMGLVSPSAWWSRECKIPKDREGRPSVWLELIATSDPRFSDTPSLENLWFKIADIEAYKTRANGEGKAKESAKGLRADLIRNYELIIAALWAKAHGNGEPGRLSNDPYTAAESLFDLLKRHGRNEIKPDTIGKKLSGIANIGIPIGSSDNSD